MMITPKSLLFVAAALAILPGCSKSPAGEAESQVSNVGPELVAVAGSSEKAKHLMVDDFSDPQKNSLGIERLFLDDTTAGGQTVTRYSFENGRLLAKGELVPARGQPAWASIALPLDRQGLPQDRSGFQGVRLVVKVNQGNLSVSANSSVITNFDYHASTVVIANDGKFHEVKIPFTDMKRAWSAQTKLDTTTLNGLSLVAFSLQKGSFDFEFDEVSFY